MCQMRGSSNVRAGGRSAALPIGEPESTHLMTFATCSSVNEMSFLNFWMPTFLSMPHGGISRFETRRLIALAHGRASSYVINDIGATDPGRWQFWQDR